MDEYTERKQALSELAECNQAILQLEKKRWYLVRKARMRGASWSHVGLALEITRQGAHKRYGSIDVRPYLFPLPSLPDEPSAG